MSFPPTLFPAMEGSAMLTELKATSALALMLLSVVSVAADAQLVATPSPVLPGHCTGGPFTLTAGEVKVHVALDDVPLAPAMDVTLRLYDSEGSVVAARRTTIAAGKTTTLEFRGSGLLRPQVTFDSLVNPGARRRTVASAEVLDIDNLRIVIPVLCFPTERIAY
jgi:hypothetical protein